MLVDGAVLVARAQLLGALVAYTVQELASDVEGLRNQHLLLFWKWSAFDADQFLVRLVLGDWEAKIDLLYIAPEFVAFLPLVDLVDVGKVLTMVRQLLLVWVHVPAIARQSGRSRTVGALGLSNSCALLPPRPRPCRSVLREDGFIQRRVRWPALLLTVLVVLLRRRIGCVAGTGQPAECRPLQLSLLQGAEGTRAGVGKAGM